jgi:hypothetical protein
MKSIAWAILIAAIMMKPCNGNEKCQRTGVVLFLICVCGFVVSLFL